MRLPVQANNSAIKSAEIKKLEEFQIHHHLIFAANNYKKTLYLKSEVK